MARHFSKVSEEEIKTAFFYPSDLVNASRLGIYPPLFTSPSGDSCIIKSVFTRVINEHVFQSKQKKTSAYYRNHRSVTILSNWFPTVESSSVSIHFEAKFSCRRKEHYVTWLIWPLQMVTWASLKFKCNRSFFFQGAKSSVISVVRIEFNRDTDMAAVTSRENTEVMTVIVRIVVLAVVPGHFLFRRTQSGDWTYQEFV